MIFAIILGCSDETITFDDPITKNKDNQNTDPLVDSGMPVEEEQEEQEEQENNDEVVDLDDIMDIFQKYSCQGCHGSSGGFRLNESELKNGTSTATGEPYIVSGMPQQSYLYLKITDASGISGQPMPIGGVGLMQDDDIEIVRQWITDGTLGL